MILSGQADPNHEGLEETIGGLATFFDANDTREEFLPWLASWVSLSLRADWDTATKRSFIQEIVSLYRLRGTKAGLARMLEIYTGQPVEINDDFAQPAHFFQVKLTLGDTDLDRLRKQQEIARAIIDQEKPAHTFYALKIGIPTMRLVSEDLRKAEKNGPKLLYLGHLPPDVSDKDGTITLLSSGN
ncbi:MAG: phage tail protein I [Anaerolineae bacterium]|nr:phage tail protein I [Anaerolineae bacterium]